MGANLFLFFPLGRLIPLLIFGESGWDGTQLVSQDRNRTELSRWKGLCTIIEFSGGEAPGILKDAWKYPFNLTMSDVVLDASPLCSPLFPALTMGNPLPAGSRPTPSRRKRSVEVEVWPEGAPHPFGSLQLAGQPRLTIPRVFGPSHGVRL